MATTEQDLKQSENNQIRLQQFKNHFSQIQTEIEKQVIGQKSVIKKILFAVFIGGNVLLEGLPGLGKTTLAKAIAQSLGLKSKRIQFTPDLMPADITGTNMLEQLPDGKIKVKFNDGPIFTSICLADEINRATPKTQAAMLEAMQEKHVTIAGETKKLPDTFCVIATQNPIELEGTYPLPEAQMDRFIFKIKLEDTSLDDLMAISDLTTSGQKQKVETIIEESEILKYREVILAILVPEYIKNYAARIIRATQPLNKESTNMVKQYVKYGASPRGMQALIMSAKVSAATKGEISINDDDIKEVVFSALRHRLILNFEGEAKQINTDEIIREILKTVEVIPKGKLA